MIGPIADGVGFLKLRDMGIVSRTKKGRLLS